jgi:hypothetical protein
MTMSSQDFPAKRAGRAGRATMAAAVLLAIAAALTACSSVSLVEPAPVRTVTVAPPPARPASAPPAAPAPAASQPPVAIASPVAPQRPPQAAPLEGEEPKLIESAGVAARFPDPPVGYHTPAFEPGRTSYASNAEIHALLWNLAREGSGAPGTTTIRLLAVGSSQNGVPLEALYFTRDVAGTAPGQSARPTVLLIGQQHGDEPAGSEALLAIAQELAQGRLAPLLDRINVVLLPRANPDSASNGASDGRRVSANGIDINRDHLLLRTPEAQAIAQLAREYDPAVVVDLHEYSVMGRYVDKFDAVQRYDVLLQYAMTANLPEFVTKASEEWFRRPLLQALKDQSLSAEWYYTTSPDVADKKVSMGGVQPDTGRNVYGLRNAVSFLIETRGIGLARAHLLRRVHSHVTAVSAILESAASRSADLLKLRQYVVAEVSAEACRNEMTVEAAATPSEYTLTMLDPQTGADKSVGVTWDSALALTPIKRRARPCGYWLRADQIDAVLRLRSLGVRVEKIDEVGAVRGETYREVSREVGQRSDVRGSIADAGDVLKVKVELTPVLLDVPAGSYYVGLDQPLANLVVAALEPDTQSGYFANRIVGSLDGEARVLQRPEFRMSAVP